MYKRDFRKWAHVIQNFSHPSDKLKHSFSLILIVKNITNCKYIYMPTFSVNGMSHVRGRKEPMHIQKRSFFSENMSVHKAFIYIFRKLRHRDWIQKYIDWYRTKTEREGPRILNQFRKWFWIDRFTLRRWVCYNSFIYVSCTRKKRIYKLTQVMYRLLYV